MAAYLVRRLAYGAFTVLGVLLLLFLLFFAIATPDDSACAGPAGRKGWPASRRPPASAL